MPAMKISVHRYRPNILWRYAPTEDRNRYYPYDLHFRRAEVWELIGAWDDALKTFRYLSRYAEDASLPELHAIQTINIGRIQYKMGNYLEAEERLLAAEAFFKRTGDIKRQAIIYQILGNLRLNQFRYQEARMLLERCLDLNAQAHDIPGLCATYGAMGNLEYLNGDLSSAEKWYLRQYEYSLKAGLRDFQAQAMGAMGCVYAQRGQYQIAIKYFKDFLSLSRTIGDKDKIAVALGNIGNYYTQFQEYSKARDMYLQQFELAKQMGKKKGICLALGNLGKASFHLGEYKVALIQIEEAIAIGEKLGLKYYLTEHYLLLSEIYLALGNLPQAEQAAAKAYQLSLENDDPDDQKSALELQARISKARSC